MLRKSLKITFFNLTLAGALWAQAEVINITSPTSGEAIDTNVVAVSFTVASYFTVGDSACTDCDGFIRVFLNYGQITSVFSTADFNISNVTDGSYSLRLEAVNPQGASFDPVLEDTVSFTVLGNPGLCPPSDLTVIAGDARNFLNWQAPMVTSNLNPFPAVPQSADYHTGTTNASAFPENSLIQGHGGPAASKEAGWAIFDIAGLNPNIEVDTIIFNYYVNAANWPYWSATAVEVDPLTASALDVHTDITDINGSGLTSAYLYQNEPSTFGPGWYSNMLINGANDDLEDDITQGYFVIGVVDRDGSATFFLDIDGWNEANPPSIDIHWSAPGGRQGVYHAPAIAEIPYSEDEIMAYKNAVSEGLTPPTALAGISEYETVSYPNSSPREVIVGCGDFQNYSIYTFDGTEIASVDTNFYLHENLTNDTEYCYYVRAEYAEGESANSDSACGTPEAYTPLPVTNLSATALDEEVALSWTAPSTSIYVEFTSFEGSDGGFTGSGGFERGVPTVGPSEAGSGAECWGTNLNANYDNSMYATITSPAYDLTGLTNPMMQINHWYNIELNWDGGNVKISNDNGSTWTILTPTVAYPVAAVNAANVGIPGEPAYSGTNSSNFWHTVQFDLSSYDTSTVMFRFDFGTDGSVTYEGWYIDDFALFEYSGGRENDGDLTHYNVYLDGVLVEDSVEVTGYLVTGLTNATTYTFGVTAAYYPDYESDAVTVSATPTWLYGDIVGTVTDPNGTPLDSAVVYSGDVVDTTGTDGQYVLMNLNPGSNLITVERNGFETYEEFVTVVAQEDAGTANFELIPKIDAPGELIATPGDETVHLIWNKPGTSLAGDLTGVWTLFFDWSCTGAPGTVEIEFMENGEFYAYGTLQGYWVGEEETVDLAESFGCDAVNYEYNAYFNFLTTPTIYYMFVDDDEFNGVITSGYGAHDGDNWGQRVDGGQARMPMGNRAVADEMLTTKMRDVIFSERMLDDATMKAQLAEQINLSKSDLYNNLANVRSLSRTSSDSLIGYNVYQVLDSGDTLVATTNSADDTTATITVPANYVEYCYNVRARWETDDYGVLESYPTDVACAVPYRSGDINFDDVVDVSDLLAVINFILELDLPTENEYRNADVNSDGEVNIADVVMIVDIILGRSSSRTLAASDVPVLVDLLRADQQLLVNLDYEGLTRGIQFTLSADASLEFGTPLLAVNDAGTMVASNRTEDGTVTVVMVNTSGGTVERAEDVLVRIPYTFKGDRSDRTVVELTDLKAVGMAGEPLPVTIREKRIDISVIPSVFALHQNYPNPFNPVTEIQFDVPKESQVTLTIYNIMGQEVTTLTNSTLKAGFHSVRWDGTNGLGEQVGTGLYFYRLSSPSFTSTKKMIMMK